MRDGTCHSDTIVQYRVSRRPLVMYAYGVFPVEALVTYKEGENQQLISCRTPLN